MTEEVLNKIIPAKKKGLNTVEKVAISSTIFIVIMVIVVAICMFISWRKRQAI